MGIYANYLRVSTNQLTKLQRSPNKKLLRAFLYREYQNQFPKGEQFLWLGKLWSELETILSRCQYVPVTLSGGRGRSEGSLAASGAKILR